MSPTTSTTAMAARQAARTDIGRYAEMVRSEPDDLRLPNPMQVRVAELHADGYMTLPATPEVPPIDTAVPVAAGPELSQFCDDGPRTNRIRYKGMGAEIQMLSAAGIRRFTADGPKVFDLDVKVTRPDGTTVEGKVRVSGSGYAWAATGHGFDNFNDRNAIAEGVASILEARKPSVGLREAGNLIQAHRARKVRTGLYTNPVSSEWIASLGHDWENGLMVVTTKSGRSYGYTGVSSTIFTAVEGALSPGKAYNRLIKHRHAGVAVELCSSCGRTHVKDRHVCPVDVPPAR